MKKHPYNILVGFDFGLKRIGVAVGQTVTKTANPLETLAAKEGEPDWGQVKKIIQRYHPDALIVGIPLNMDGTDQPITEATRHFIKKLETQFDMPVFGVDERLSTKVAREILFEEGGYKALQGGRVDQVAAKIMLEHWMREHGKC